MIIGLTGTKCSGKDTFADYLVEKYDFVKVSFADNLKNILKKMFNWTDKHFNRENKEIECKEWGISPREAMQLMGTEVLREQFNMLYTTIDNVKYTYHIKYLHNIISKINKNIVISDVRFQDEITYIHNNDGLVFKINRKTNIFDKHKSENQKLKKIDHYFNNNGSLKEYYNDIDSIFNLLL